MEPPVTDEDEPAVTPLEEGEEGVAPPGEVSKLWGLEVGDGLVDPGVVTGIPVDVF